MSKHEAGVLWERGDLPFTYETYPRDHRITFGSGASMTASAAAEFRGNPSLPNPEEQLVSALATCHMLTFLAIAAKRKLTVDRYEDSAEGTLAKNEQGRLAIVRCVLRPRVRFADGVSVDAETMATMHKQAHHGCFIAASVKTEVLVEAQT